MSMKKMGKLVLSALSVLGLAACAVGSTDESFIGESEQALIAPNGGFYGSDTLFNAITDAIANGWGVGGLTYLGTGSGKGEQCLEGTGSAPCNTKVQTIAPMSRDLNGTCDSGQKSNRIALDAIALWTKSTQAASNLTNTDVADAFCGTNRNGTGCTEDLWSEIVSGASNPSNAIKLYRRDNLSGTTEVFLQKNSCTAFCPSVKIVVDDETAGPRLSTDAAGTSSLVSGGTCAATDSATKCIGKIAASDIDVLAYSGLDASATGNKALNINTVAPTAANIRSAAYYYSRFLYLNEGNGTRDPLEADFLDWAFGRSPYGSSDKAAFEDILISHGFIACTDPSSSPRTPLACGSSGTTCPSSL
ncbi:substrate-binding domain-containing protein [Sorangium sp. So ce726]|uniref:PstS family phosphate ABC transporter substrate-binding protein n=1 Tax=Sorangium sp. So ce726 TaxID=3133319 RepID=UPI003F60E903